MLNTCRALRWAGDRTWTSKTDAGTWRWNRHRDTVVRDALSDRPLVQEDVGRFLQSALDELAAAT